MREASDKTDFHGDIARLARTLHRASDGLTGEEAVLDEVTTAATRMIPAVDHAGVTLIHRVRGKRPDRLDSAAATGPIPAAIDELQVRLAEGPCVEAAWEHHTVRIDDLDTDGRWPTFAKAARAETPVRSSLSIELFTDDAQMGALNLYADEVGAFDIESEDLAVNLAAHAAIALANARRGTQFRSALASRDIIGQAKGIIMERFDIDAIEAFRLLNKLSQDSNTPLAEVALRLVEVDHPTVS